jgi:hypothetical protein
MAFQQAVHIARRSRKVACARNRGVSGRYRFFFFKISGQDEIPGTRFADERQGIGHGDGIRRFGG